MGIDGVKSGGFAGISPSLNPKHIPISSHTTSKTTQPKTHPNIFPYYVQDHPYYFKILFLNNLSKIKNNSQKIYHKYQKIE
jgi:hypothetical protein